jgi:hypothetical protein
MVSFQGNIEMATSRQFSFPKKPISEYTSDSALSTIMKNAKRLHNDDIYWETFRRPCQLKRSGESELERAFNQTLAAYGILKSEKAGKTIRATRVRQKTGRVGFKKVLEDWAVSKDQQDGLKYLIGNGQFDLTGEWLVHVYHDEFSPEVVAQARKRLLDAGVPKEKLKLA